jgi:hypothetical protein
MRSKNGVLCAAAKTNKTIFAPNDIYCFFSNLHNKLLFVLQSATMTMTSINNAVNKIRNNYPSVNPF